MTPVPTEGQGVTSGPDDVMQILIEPIFPDEIQNSLQSLEEGVQADIKKVYDFYVPGIDNCGELVFTCPDFSLLNATI